MIKEYKESGGWFWSMIGLIFILASAYSYYQGESTEFMNVKECLFLALCIIMEKLERISNGLKDASQ